MTETTVLELMALADNMAAAAASFNAHGYDSFIHAREQLKQAFILLCNTKTY